MAGLIEHLESFLGLITGGSRGDDATPEGVQVAWFGPDVPFGGVTTLVTVGLSRRHLGLPNGWALHQELVMHVTTRLGRPGCCSRSPVRWCAAGPACSMGK